MAYPPRTGDRSGQVVSQTVTSLATAGDAIRRPVLRALVGRGGGETIEQAHPIRTADISRPPDDDCCQLLAPSWPATRAGGGDQ
ncbi:hypothetical protein [Plantactinospora sp. WMMB782]|uniref:hypothetical protein n=1 Tax=Plantactinospora sp. WMMB782 TaxID=3404121 RepID=UPI003B961EF7